MAKNPDKGQAEGQETEDTRKVEVFLPFGIATDYVRLIDQVDTPNGKTLEDAVDFVVSHKIIRSWNLTAEDGTPLDPTKRGDWDPLDTPHVRWAVRQVTLHHVSTRPKG